MYSKMSINICGYFVTQTDYVRRKVRPTTALGTDIRNILLLGNGYVAGPCLNYLLRRPENVVTVASRRADKSLALTKGRPQTFAIALDVNDEKALEAQIAQHHLVIR